MTAAPHLAQIAAMHAAARSQGMAAVIVCTSSPEQEAYWQERLTATRGQVAGPRTQILAVHEDWPGGAGNGLGTLYALRRAQAKARALGAADPLALLAAGATVALYHTAGQGTRLAPLPASEANNKPAVKLPSLVEVGGQLLPLTILEAVIRQTGVYAAGQRGRLLVFWGDQLFVPTQVPAAPPPAAAALFCRLGPLPSAEDWAAQRLHHYGLVVVDAAGHARQIEKIPHATATRLLAEGRLDAAGGLGVSMGSFSIAADFLVQLLAEFAPELAGRQGKLDTDPHFWMPLTLDRETYLHTMAAKAVPATVAEPHFHRMQRLRAAWRDQHPDRPLLGAVEIGGDAYWWDYGTLASYAACHRRLLDDDAEAEAMRRFFGLSRGVAASALGEVTVDAASIVVACRLGRGQIRRGVLVGVEAAEIAVDDGIVLASAGPRLEVTGGLLYQAHGEARLGPGQVRADVYLPPDETLTFSTDLSRDGRADWAEPLPGNPLSYAELYARNQRVDPAAAAALAARCRARVQSPGGAVS